MPCNALYSRANTGKHQQVNRIEEIAPSRNRPDAPGDGRAQHGPALADNRWLTVSLTGIPLFGMAIAIMVNVPMLMFGVLA